MKKNRVFRAIIVLLGAAVGINFARLLILSTLFTPIPEGTMAWLSVCIYVVLGTGFGILGYLITSLLIKLFSFTTRTIVKYFSSLSMGEIFLGSIGLIFGLVVALLTSTLTSKIEPPILGTICSIFVFLICGYIGWIIPTKRVKEINMPKWFKKNEQSIGKTLAVPKVLDTSAIIDGRFFDVYRTGIVEGTVIVPQFVLRELQHIADSADPIKRSRGRRGLDVLDSMKDSESVVIYDKDYPDIPEVDAKILRFASDNHGMIITTDYNLNKLATVQQIPVFNVNDLANSLKITVTAGQDIVVTIVKEGKEMTQGVAYFDDGTMIVVEGARQLIGETIEVVVTSVLQTSAGRMVFAKIKE